MIQQPRNRIDPKRRAGLDYKKKQFASPTFTQQDYAHRLNFYELPPTTEITLEQFEQWAIDRLRSIPFLPCGAARRRFNELTD
jgi:DNA primase large subunit